MSFPLQFPKEEPLLTVTHRTHALQSSCPSADPFGCRVATSALWIIELHNGDDSRLTHELLSKAFLPALDDIERAWRSNWRVAQQSQDKNGGKGALIIVGNRKQNKFFSNGDLMPNRVVP